MNTPSEEQQYIIDHILTGKNVIVDACAGSGKSTTILNVATQCSHRHILQCTYNKQLRLDVEEKVKELKIPNLVVHNYHSLAKAFYSKDGHTDTGIREILSKQMCPLKEIPSFDIIVIDEAQDMTKLYFELLIKFTIDMPNDFFQLLILGDKMQGLYEFKGSDIRFLTLGHSCWEDHHKLKNKEFEFCTLKMSYRITNEMSHFVNNAMLGHERLWACREGPKVVYVRKDRYSMETNVVATIMQLIANGAKYSDFFCLNASIKNSRFYNPVRKIENLLAEKGIPCFIPNDETNEQLDNRVIDRKVVFTTFHSVKGRQRKYVIVFGFDDSYFHFYARNLPTDTCPNTLYVACTRGTQQLIVLESKENVDSRPLPFLQMSHMEMKSVPYIHFQGDPMTFAPLKKEKKEETEIKREVTPTELIRFIPDHILDIITPIVQDVFSVIQPPEDISLVHELHEIPSVIETKMQYYEDVSDINGIALPIMFFDKLRQTQIPVLQNIIDMNVRNMGQGKHTYLQQEAENMPSTCETTADYLYLANLSIATHERLYSKLKMIGKDEYTWLSDQVIQSCFHRMEQVVGPECRNDRKWTPERTIIRYSDDMDHHYIDQLVRKEMEDKTTLYRFCARVDLMTPDSIWELKCTSELSFDHKLQLIIYTWLYYMKYPEEKRQKKTRKSFLFNIKTGELLELNASIDQLSYVVIQLLQGKFHRDKYKDDPTFIEEMKISMNRLINPTT